MDCFTLKYTTLSEKSFPNILSSLRFTLESNKTRIDLRNNFEHIQSNIPNILEISLL